MKACTIKVLTKRAITTAITIASRYSLVLDLLVVSFTDSFINAFLSQAVFFSVRYSPDPVPPDPVLLAVPREENDEGLADDVLAFNEPPEPAVRAVVPVIPHHEIRPLRDPDGAEIVAGLHRPGEDQRVGVLPLEVRAALPVDQELLVPDLDRVAAHPDHALDVVH